MMIKEESPTSVFFPCCCIVDEHDKHNSHPVKKEEERECKGHVFPGKGSWKNNEKTMWFGKWHENAPHGYGSLRSESLNFQGCVYGNYLRGDVVWSSSSVTLRRYSGDGIIFMNHARQRWELEPHGSGKMIYYNSGIFASQYEGNFVIGKRKGRGKITTADGQVVEAFFDDFLLCP